MFWPRDCCRIIGTAYNAVQIALVNKFLPVDSEFHRAATLENSLGSSIDEPSPDRGGEAGGLPDDA
jgi:hypothetical protein